MDECKHRHGSMEGGRYIEEFCKEAVQSLGNIMKKIKVSIKSDSMIVPTLNISNDME